jgi:hypothetical protein
MQVEYVDWSPLLKKLYEFAKAVYPDYLKPFTLGILTWFEVHAPVFKTLSMLIMIGSTAGITYLILRLRRVQVAEYEKYKPVNIEEEAAKARQVQWEIILQHLGSENPAEWKLGILEADNILDELLEERGYRGETLGDRLKFAEAKGLKTLNDAWEAHKARNKIVHEEATSPINKRDARKIIDLYEKVFKELGYL